MLKAIDVCAGAGGWSIAARGLPVQIVEAFDIAADCLETYAYNHPETKTTRIDATKLDWKKLRGIDIVLGGIPCEEVSPARRGLFRKPKPGTIRKWHALIDSVLAGIDSIKPRYWALENVIQMRRHLPPLTPFWIVNAAKFCGQSRRRMFAGRFPLPPLPDDSTVLRDYLRPGPYVLPAHVVKMDFRMQGKQFTEAAALQGFPGDYVFVSTPDRAWKMVAQAIPIPVGRAILEAIVAEQRKEEVA